MSLIDELANNGFTAEDLEKAASVRLFEKVATEDGIDLSTLSDEDVDTLFGHFVTEILPHMTNEDAGQAADDREKAASVMLFQKVASAEGIDLNDYSEDQINGMYGVFLDDILPSMYQEEEKNAEVEEAQAKLAEMDILGRHMARAYHDELSKLGGGFVEGVRRAATGAGIREGMETLRQGKKLKGAGEIAKRMAGEASKPSHVRELAGEIGGKRLRQAAETAAAGKKQLLGGIGRTGALYGTGALAAGGTGLAAKKVMDRKNEKAASVLFDKLAEERANEILQHYSAPEEPDFDDMINQRAIEMLEANGYTFE